MSQPALRARRDGIVNGAECGPFLTADHRVMVERSRGGRAGPADRQYILGTRSGYICGGQQARRHAGPGPGGGQRPVPGGGDPAGQNTPQGSKKQLIYAPTRRKVPAGGLPIDAGVVVINASTAAAIADAGHSGCPWSAGW